MIVNFKIPLDNPRVFRYIPDCGPAFAHRANANAFGRRLFTHATMWYALQAHAGHEERVGAYLALEGVESYWPSIFQSVHDRHNPRQHVSVKRALFPGYLFVALANGRLHSACPRVVGVVGFGGQPAPILDAEVASVRLMEASPSVQRCCPILEKLRACPDVYVREGPLTGVRGKVIRINAGTRVLVSIGMIGQSISAEVKAEWLEILAPRGSKC